jgi:putative ABC transport system ATP-binding protein
VLFADEPTGALDSLAGEQVMELLTATVREQNTTVVLVTHEPRVAAYADREVIVRDGRVTSPVSVAPGYRSRCGSRSVVGGRRWPGSSRSFLLSQ